MERWDAVVVGAGPAGSLSAYHLARGGARVLLLDRATFPRDKPCGGGLTGRALRQLPFAVDPVVEHTVDRLEFGLRYAHRFERRAGGALVLMTRRWRLDAFLAEQAAEAGAVFRDGVRATGISLDGGVPEIALAGGNVVRADVAIGADGANGITARALGLANDLTYGVALEGNVPHRDVNVERYDGRAVIELGIVAGGYGWVFPKGDHVNVGVGGWEWEGARLRGHLARLCAQHSIASAALTDLRGFRLPLRGPGTIPARGRVLLVGDAAGLVDPLSGDGMYEAFLSAHLAARAVFDLLAGRAETLDPYASALNEAVSSQLSTSWAAKRAFDRFPRTSYAVARLPPVWRAVEKLVRGDLSHPGAARGTARVPFRLIEALGRSGDGVIRVRGWRRRRTRGRKQAGSRAKPATP